jgi:hypothetical protein
MTYMFDRETYFLDDPQSHEVLAEKRKGKVVPKVYKFRWTAQRVAERHFGKVMAYNGNFYVRLD